MLVAKIEKYFGKKGAPPSQERMIVAQLLSLLLSAMPPNGAAALDAILAPLPLPMPARTAELSAEMALHNTIKDTMTNEAPHLDATDIFVERAAQLHAAQDAHEMLKTELELENGRLQKELRATRGEQPSVVGRRP